MTSPFFQHKKAFFETNKLAPRTINDVLNKTNVNFAFISNNRESIEHEFNQLYAALNNNGENREEFWVFCYQTCFMLKTYYESYSPEKAAEYSSYLDLIVKQVSNPVLDEVVDDELSFLGKIDRDIQALKKIPFSSAKLRDLAAKATMQRISTRFTMITLKESLLVARQLHVLDLFEKLTGRAVNIDILDAPLGIYNALSVGIFAIRFTINITMLLKHVLYPVGSENDLTKMERLYVELKKRHYQLVNDSVWMFVNALTNYSAYFNIAPPLAAALMVGFLVFDACWLAFALHLVELDYVEKKREYEAYKNTGITPAELSMLHDQIEQLERSTENKRMMFRFYIAAASLLVASLAAAFFVLPAALTPVCYLVCNLAVAMYLTGHLYGVYKEKCLIADQTHAKKGLDIFKANQDVEDAWDDLVSTMVKNTVAPFIIIGAFTVSVPLAVVLAAAYVASQSGCDYVSKASLSDGLNNFGVWSSNAAKSVIDTFSPYLVGPK